MNRRSFLHRASNVLSGLSLCRFASFSARASTSADWRTFEITTRIEVLNPSGTTRVWAPEALIADTHFQKTIANTFQCEGSVKTFRNAKQSLGIIAANFPAGVKPILTVTSRAATRNWAVNVSSPARRQEMRSSELNKFLEPTKMLPTDGIVKQRALEITKNAKTDVAKARAIYEWIVENTYRNPKTRGCGTGDIRFMLESGDLGGKCADLNALFVGLARAAGLPARDVYGIRVSGSQMGYKSLGASSTNVTKAQHCRAEVYLSGYGWAPVDPADVRKVMLEEPPGDRPLSDEMVKRARARLFGSWEMNWIAYNFAQDIVLPGSTGPPLHFFMYPQAETARGRVDCLDPQGFQYEITAREITHLSG